MKHIITSLVFSLGAISAPASIEILYLAPTDDAPVLGSISTTSEAFQNARPVEGKADWMETVRKDFYSGFIARDSLTPEGTVEPGTALLLTPSKKGRVLTTIEEDDDVTVNLVDDWTEITVNKAIPGYFQPRDPEEEEETRRNAPPATTLGYANDPLLDQARQTRYTAPPVPNPSAATSDPVAARGVNPTPEPMTGFEEVDSLNPAFGRTAPDGMDRGYDLGSGSTPIPAATAAAAGSSTFLDGSMEDPTSIARIPAGSPSEVAPTQEEEVSELQAEQEEEGPSMEDRMANLESMLNDVEAGEMDEQTVEDSSEAAATQNAAVEEIETPIPAPVEESVENKEQDAQETSDEESAEVIPLAPAAEGSSGTVAATAAAAAATAATASGEEPVEETPVEIMEVSEEVEVAEEVAEATVPGITQPVVEEEPALIPPTDTNRTYIGRLQQTRSGLFGKKAPERYEIVNFKGDRIAYVNLDAVVMSSEEKFIDRIVRVYGVMDSPADKDYLIIQAANITLR